MPVPAAARRGRPRGHVGVAHAPLLAAHGVATLRYDKRGVGGSVYPGLSEQALRFEHLVDDAPGEPVDPLELRRQVLLGLLELLERPVLPAASPGALLAAARAARTEESFQQVLWREQRRAEHVLELRKR